MGKTMIDYVGGNTKIQAEIMLPEADKDYLSPEYSPFVCNKVARVAYNNLIFSLWEDGRCPI